MPAPAPKQTARQRCGSQAQLVRWRAWMGSLLLAACSLGAGSQPAAGQAQNNAPQNGQPPNAQQTGAPAPAAQNSEPMVLGEGPDAGQDGDSVSPAPAAGAAQPSAAPGTLVPWPSPAGAAAVAGKPQPPLGPPAPVSALVPVPPPADAGGDTVRQQINNECVDLLKMANDLKSAVDKTNKNVLSVQVVRKANAIEQLAHRVKNEMRPAVATNAH